MIELTVSEPTAIELEVIEAKIKPEQTKTVTPTYEAQTVLPDAGTTLGQVNVEAIPDPTAIKEIDSNGDHDVRRYGTARVDVQPTLQSKSATPTEQAQTILPDTGYDGLESVNIARIPTEYIVPTGTKNISQNGTESVREYDSVNVNVVPTLQDKTIVPTKQTQTATADSGYDGLDTVQVDPIPSEYIVPQGKTTITQNGTVNVSQYAEAEVSVSAAAQLVLLDTINVGDFAEQVNMVNIDLSNYDLTGYNVLYIVVDNIVSSGADWMYFNADGYSVCYFDGSKTTHNAKKAIQYNDGTDWRSVLGLMQATGRFPGSGDPAAVNIVHFKFYKAATTFVSGRFLIYAI